jgi:excisionase family DNA binding protein
VSVDSSRSAGVQADALEDHLLTAADVAKYLQCSRQAVYLWVELGRLPHLKLGRLVRFREDDLAEFLRQRTVPANGSNER